MSNYGYYGDVWYLYLAQLLRTSGFPKEAYKIGITNARDPMLRLTYTGADEPHPITKYFPEIHLLRYISFATKYKAESAERFIMYKIKQMSKEARFHNWEEPDAISGITEMRIWNFLEVSYIKNRLMDQCIERYS